MSRVRFGVFEFDPASGELRREGSLLRLQAQPSQVLAVLVARVGEVVTREELRNAVWSEGTFVDFDGGLNFCIAQIRSTLGDSAESPRFVKTVPKKGYQFIAPVSAVETLVQPPARPAPSRMMVIVRLAMLAITLGTAIYTGKMLWQGAPDPIRVAVVRFDNQTGNPDFERFASSLTDLLVTELTRATEGRAAVIGNAAILHQPREQRDLTTIGSTLKAQYIVMGQVQRDDARVRVLAHLIRLPEQTHLTAWRQDLDTNSPTANQDSLARAIVAKFVGVLFSSPAARN